MRTWPLAAVNGPDDVPADPYLGRPGARVACPSPSPWCADEAPPAHRRRAAVVMLVESTGDGAAPEGHLRHRYAVDLGAQTLLAATQAEDADTLAERRATLDLMSDSLEIHDG